MFGMAKSFRKKPGLTPGTLVYTGEQKIERTRIRVIQYDSEELEEKEFDSIEEAFPYLDSNKITWLNIDGLHEVEIIEKIGQKCEFHPLALEDILSTAQPPKMDDFEKYLVIILKMLSWEDEQDALNIEQLSLILGPNYVVTFQERVGDYFDPVRERLRRGRGRIRTSGADYLAYALVDIMVDYYFHILDRFGEKIAAIEEGMVANPEPSALQEIHRLKKDVIYLRKSVWPLREIILKLVRGDIDLVTESTIVFLRDVYDHTIQVIETIETFRDLLSGLQDLYLSSVSNKMNEVMKVLTIIATIFIPITFVAGVYGMNFKNMPELEWGWGYPFAWMLIAGISIIMIIYFKTKKWL
jgi:magnesium transporter